MHSPVKNVALGAVTLAALAFGVLAFQQHQRLQELEKELAKISTERDQARKSASESEQRVATAETGRASAEDEIKKLRAAPPVASSAPSTGQRRGPENRMAAMDNPASQKMIASSIKGSLDQRYAGLFRKLKLSPANLEKLKDLLTERQLGNTDVMRAAQAQGLNPATHQNQLIELAKSVQQENDDRIQELLGEEGFAQFQDFSQNIGSHGLVDQIDRRLSFTDSPLNAGQSQALLRVLAETSQPTTPPGRGPSVNFIAGSGWGAGNSMFAAMSQPRITDATIAAAQGVLNSAQIEVLKQIQTEQQNQTAAMQSLRNTTPITSGTPQTLPAPAP